MTAIVGSVELLVFGFGTPGSLPPKIRRQLDALRGRGVIRILDVLYVSKDEQGVIGIEQDGEEFDAHASLAESPLWQLLDGFSPMTLPAASLELHSAGEVGLDLDAVERFAQLIQPNSSALLMLVESTWATDLLDAVLTSGGLPIVFGCLEPETMLVIGLHLASAALAAEASERSAAVHGAATLDALATTKIVSATAADVIKSLVAARLLHDDDVEDALGALAGAGIIPLPSLVRARKQADATLAKITPIGVRRDPA